MLNYQRVSDTDCFKYQTYADISVTNDGWADVIRSEFDHLFLSFYIWGIS